MTTSPLPYDVLIVGAGPVGLATAIGLQQRGVHNFLVIDQTREFRRVGQIVDLLPNGLKALRFVCPSAYESLLATQHQAQPPQAPGSQAPPPKRFWIRKNLQGETLRSTSLDFDDWLKRYGEGRISTAWFNLQTKLRELLDPQRILINHRCLHLAQTDAGVEVQCQTDPQTIDNPFAHWEKAAPLLQGNGDSPTGTSESLSLVTFSSKLVVAADGINSTVRRLLYHDTELEPWATPDYSGWAALGCLQMKPVPETIATELNATYSQGQMIVSLHNDQLPPSYPGQASPRIMLVNRGEQGFGFLLHTPLPLDCLADITPTATIQLAVKTLTDAGFPPCITDFVGYADPDQIISRPYHQHSADPCNHFPNWSHQRVVLAGDAAHGMPPFIAQGTNQGFEDAAFLVPAIARLVEQQQLDDLATIQQVFNDYEHYRRPLMAKVQTATLESDSWTNTQWQAFSQQLYQRMLAI